MECGLSEAQLPRDRQTPGMVLQGVALELPCVSLSPGAG